MINEHAFWAERRARIERNYRRWFRAARRAVLELA
jgi:hypothetical protein